MVKVTKRFSHVAAFDENCHHIIALALETSLYSYVSCFWGQKRAKTPSCILVCATYFRYGTAIIPYKCFIYLKKKSMAQLSSVNLCYGVARFVLALHPFNILAHEVTNGHANTTTLITG